MKRQIYLYSSFFLILIFFGGIFLSGVSFTGRAVDEDCKGSFFECLAKNAKTLEKQNEEKISVEDKLTNNNFFEEQETNIFENDFNSFQYRSRDNMFLGQNDFLLSDRENENFPINKGENIGEYEGYIVEFEEKPLLVLKSDLEEEVSYKKETEAQTKGVSKFILKTFSKDSEILEEEASVKLEKQREILQQTSENFKAKLEEESISREIISEEFYFSFSGVSVGKLTKEEKEKIESMPGIKRVTPNYRVKAFLMDSVSLVEADLVWQISDPNNSSLNLTGEGIKIAIIDTGIDYTHPDLGSCTSSSFLKGKCEKVLGGYDFVNNDFDPMDDNGHGTHCASIAAGKGILKGVAPDAKLYGFKVLSSAGGGDFSDVISAIERSVDLNNNGIPLEDENDYVDIISLSLGGQGNPDDPVSQAIDNVVSAGVIAVIAVGNDGLWNGPIGSPATSRKAISVGASDKNDLMASFSSRGPVLWEDAQGKIKSLSKPDVVAPGDGFFSSQGICAAQWNDAWSDRECIDNQHTSIPGTSMATPHVAGAVALIKQAHPDWSPEEIKMVLKNSAQNLNGAGIKDQGQGRINVRSSLNFSKPLIASLNEIDYLPSGQMNILGSAKGDDFYSYSVFYSKYQSTNLTLSTNWNLICSGNNVVDEGVLCSNFDTFNLVDGMYQIKLVVYGNNSIQSKDFGFFKINNFEILNPSSSDIYKLGDVIEIQLEILNPVYNFSSINIKNSLTGISFGSQGTILINNTFATWNTSSLNEGFYDLILTYEFKGSYFVEEIKNIQLDSTLRGVIVIDPLISNNGIYSDLRVADLDGNGLKEIALKGFNEVVVYNQDGSLFSGWPQQITPYTGVFFYPWSYAPLTIGDINNDGKKEIFSSWSQLPNGTLAPWGVDDDGYCLYGWNYNSSALSNFPVRCLDNFVWSPSSPVILEDINGDGFLELILGVIDEGEQNFKIFVFSRQGQLMSGWPVEISFGQSGSNYGPLAVVDLDSDGKKEILFSSDEISIFDYEGNFKKHLHTRHSKTQFSIGDLIGNDSLEILILENSWLLELFDFDGLVSEWGQNGEVSIPGFSISSGSLGDLDNDGIPEIVIGSSYLENYGEPDPYYQDKIYILKANGSISNYWNISDTDFYKEIRAQPIIADINGNGNQDIIANVLGLEGNQLYAWNSDGSIINGFPKNLGGNWVSSNSPVVDDIDNDGKLEILVYVYKFIEDVNMPGYATPLNKIFIFDLDTPYNPNKMDWPMYIHDTQNTGNYNFGQTPSNTSTVQCFSSSLIGDANADGAINSVDALLISQVFVQLIPTPNNICCLDVNRDGAINSADSLLVMRYFVGYPNTGYAGQLCSSI